MRLGILNNAIGLVIETCESMFPEVKDAVIFFTGPEEAGAAGYTTKNEKGEWIIGINDEIPYSAVPEIIAHEVAHVVKESRNLSQNPQDEHNEEWEKLFEDIQVEFMRRAKVLGEKIKKEGRL